MRTNSEIVDIIIDLCNQRGWSLSEFARKLDLPKSSISRYFNKSRQLPINKINLFADTLGVSSEFLLGIKISNNDLLDIYNKLDSKRQSKVYEFASRQLDEQNGIQEEKVVYLVRGRQSAAGSMIHVDDVDAEMGVLPSSIVPNGANELVQITGDSMEPLIKKGSEVYLRYQPTVEDGEVAIVRVEDEGVTCKYLYRDGKNVILKSENPKYEDLIVDAERVSVIGKVLL
jgi:peptidase S24-like protein|nr:MAG TPA: Repressor protein CI [Caudoviricetes sp.]